MKLKDHRGTKLLVRLSSFTFHEIWNFRHQSLLWTFIIFIRINPHRQTNISRVHNPLYKLPRGDYQHKVNQHEIQICYMIYRQRVLWRSKANICLRRVLSMCLTSQCVWILLTLQKHQTNTHEFFFKFCMHNKWRLKFKWRIIVKENILLCCYINAWKGMKENSQQELKLDKCVRYIWKRHQQGNLKSHSAYDPINFIAKWYSMTIDNGVDWMPSYI
jgi:hypothetical protein